LTSDPADGTVYNGRVDFDRIRIGTLSFGGDDAVRVDEIRMSRSIADVTPGVPSLLLGDVNLDGNVNGLDVGPFVVLVTSGGYQAEADMNGDLAVNGLDVSPFVAAIVGGDAQAIPEPSALALATLAALGLLSWRREGR
jgi:hypothetical protein